MTERTLLFGILLIVVGIIFATDLLRPRKS